MDEGESVTNSNLDLSSNIAYAPSQMAVFQTISTDIQEITAKHLNTLSQKTTIGKAEILN